jgi:hypothetical protein
MLVDRVQIRGDNRESSLYVVDHVAPARIDVADQNPPTRVLADIGRLSPEAQNENLIEQGSL